MSVLQSEVLSLRLNRNFLFQSKVLGGGFPFEKYQLECTNTVIFCTHPMDNFSQISLKSWTKMVVLSYILGQIGKAPYLGNFERKV